MNAQRWIVVGVSGILTATTLLAEGVSLTRYKLRIVGTHNLESVDPDVIDDFCRDDDGCGVTIRIERPPNLRVKSGRFFLSVAFPLHWTSTAYESTDVIFADADDTAQTILAQSNGGHSCVFTDGDNPLSFDDSVPGFILAVRDPGNPLPTLSTTCVLVLID